MWYDSQREKLNTFQIAAAEDLSDACVVNANVGSGKTTVLVSKVFYLNEIQKVSCEDMVVLTFTNKAADEIKERLLSEHQEDFPWIGTFHGVAMKLLKTKLADELEGWTAEFSVMDPDEELELAQRIISENGLKIKYKNRLKKRLEQEKEGSRYGDDLLMLRELLINEKKRWNQMSFDDLISCSTEYLKRKKQILKTSEQETEKVWPKWILVDEVQDSDRAQLEFLKELRQDGTKIFAVGDPNQVIYSWRGGMETMFYEWKRTFQAKELTLPVNYRSSAAILEAAGRFMQNGNKITAVRDGGEQICVKNHYDPFQEAQYLAGKIRSIHEQGLPYHEIAIFYRLQHQAEILEKVFEKEGIPYRISLRRTLKDFPVLDWLQKVLRFSCNPENLYAAQDALMDKEYGEGVSRKKAQSIVKEEKEGYSELYDKMKQFLEICGEGVVFTPEMPVDDWLYTYFEMEDRLHPTSRSFQEENRLVRTFLKRIREDYEQGEKCLAESINLFLGSAALYGAGCLEEGKTDHIENRVNLMTLHASKGLEFSHVFIVGVNQGLIPLKSSGFDSEEEERRLFFVGITRAKNSLELSYYTNPGQPGILGGPGFYLKMLPGHLLDWKENPNLQDKEKHLQELRKAVREEIQKNQVENRTKYLLNGQTENRTENLLNGQLENRIESQLEKEAVSGTAVSEQRMVRHPKYGTGHILSEDEMMLEVEFPNYGKKSFMKAFSGLEFL